MYITELLRKKVLTNDRTVGKMAVSVIEHAFAAGGGHNGKGQYKG